MPNKSRSPTTASESLFYSDIQKNGMQYAALIRSTEIGRRVTGVMLDGIVPREYLAFTAKDIVGQNLIQTEETGMPVFAEAVSYSGEPIGILVGPEERLVHEYLENVHIQYAVDTSTEALEDQIIYETPTPLDLLIEEETGETEPTGFSGEPEHLDETGKPLAEPERTPPGTENILPGTGELIDEPENTPPGTGDTDETGETAPPSVRELNELAENTAPAGEEYREPLPQEEVASVVYERLVTAGDPDQLFEEASLKLTYTFQNNLSYPICGENAGALVTVGKTTATVYTPTQWSSHLRENVHRVTGIPQENIHIKRTICGETGINGVWYTTILSCQAAVASQRLGCPVRLVLTPEEQHQFIENTTPVTITHHVGIDEDGTILAAKTNITVDTGAYSPFVSQLVDRLAIAAFGPYQPLSLKIQARALQSAHVPTTSSIQGADSLSFFAIESLMEQIALATKSSSLAIHLKNLSLDTDNGLKRAPMPFLFESGSLFPIYDQITKTSDFERKEASYAQNTLTLKSAESPAPVRGIGLADAYEGHGYYSSAFNTLRQKLELTLETDGSVTIHAQQPGESITTIWKQLVSQLLEIDPKAVNFDKNYLLADEEGRPESVKGNISIQTQLIKKCCLAIQKQRFREPLPISVKKTLGAPRTGVWEPETFTGTPYYFVSWGAAIVELEIDSSAYSIQVRGIYLALDVGEILSRAEAETSVIHACNTILMNLIENQRLECNNINITFLESSEEPKQIGQLIYNILPAAFANAVAQATKKPVCSLPLKVDSLYRMIQDENSVHAQQ